MTGRQHHARTRRGLSLPVEAKLQGCLNSILPRLPYRANGDDPDRLQNLLLSDTDDRTHHQHQRLYLCALVPNTLLSVKTRNQVAQDERQRELRPSRTRITRPTRATRRTAAARTAAALGWAHTLTTTSLK